MNNENRLLLRKDRRRLYKYLFLSLLWMLFIFWHSLQTAEESSQESLRFLSFLQKILPDLSHRLLRKLGHFTEFAILGGLFRLSCVQGLRRFSPQKSSNCFLSFALPLGAGLLTAACDEWIQTGVPGRSGEIRDVLIDLGGVICGILLMALFQSIRLKHRPSTPPPPQ